MIKLNRKSYVNLIYIFLLISLIFGIINLFLFKIGLISVGFILLILSIFMTVLSLNLPNSYSVNIKKGDWKLGDDNNYFFCIKEINHGMGKNPFVQAYILCGKWKEDIGVLPKIDNSGNIFIYVNTKEDIIVNVFI